MESKRFGGGLLGGLLLGVVVILIGTVAAAPSVGLFGSFSPSSASAGLAKGTSDVATYTLTYTTTATATLGLYQTVNGSATAPGRTNTTTIVTTVTTVTTTFPVYNGLSSLSTSGQAQASPSRLNSIAARPFAAGGLVLVPVLIAIVAGAIGALLYRASINRKEDVPSENVP